MDDIFTKFWRVKQTLQWFMIMAEQTNDGVVLVDLNGIIRFVNAAMANMHGYLSNKDLIGKKISEFHSEDQMNIDVFPMARLVGLHRVTGIAQQIQQDLLHLDLMANDW